MNAGQWRRLFGMITKGDGQDILKGEYVVSSIDLIMLQKQISPVQVVRYHLAEGAFYYVRDPATLPNAKMLLSEMWVRLVPMGGPSTRNPLFGGRYRRDRKVESHGKQGRKRRPGTRPPPQGLSPAYGVEMLAAKRVENFGFAALFLITYSFVSRITTPT
jgi:hypothetical protein